VKVGDTITLEEAQAPPLAGFRESKPMVYCGLYPSGETTYDQLREAVEKLSLNDASSSGRRNRAARSATASAAASSACCTWRSARSASSASSYLDMVQTAPTVTYIVKRREGVNLEITTPGEIPKDGYEAIEEPIVTIHFMVPADKVGVVMTLASERRGIFQRQDYMGTARCVLSYRMPLAEVIYDLFDA